MKKILVIYCLFLSVNFLSGMDLHQAAENGDYSTIELMLYNKMTLSEYREIESFLLQGIAKEYDSYARIRKSAQRQLYTFDDFTIAITDKIAETRESFKKIREIFENNPVIQADEFKDISSHFLESIRNITIRLQTYSLDLLTAKDVTDLHPLELKRIKFEEVEAERLKKFTDALDKHKADYINRLKNNETALYAACKYNKISEAKLLLENGADPNLGCTKSGNTPLHITCYNGNLTLAELLIHHNADPHALASACLPNDKEQRIVSYSTLARACENTFQLKIIKLLFKYKVKPYNYANSLDPHSVLHSAWSRLYPNAVTYHINPLIIPSTLDIVKLIANQYDHASAPYSVIGTLIGLLKACGREIKENKDAYKPSCTYNLTNKTLGIALFTNPGAVYITLSQYNHLISIKSYKQNTSFMYMGDYLQKNNAGKELELCEFEPAQTPDQFLKNIKKCLKNNYWVDKENAFYYLLAGPVVKKKLSDIKINFA